MTERNTDIDWAYQNELRRQWLKDNPNAKNNDSPSNLRAISKSKNVAKENKRRAGKKENEK